MYEKERSNFEIFQKMAQMPFKGPRIQNKPNRRRKTYCCYVQRSKICKKSKINPRNGQNDHFEAKIMHFPVILSEKLQRLYTFQPYDLVQ